MIRPYFASLPLPPFFNAASAGESRRLSYGELSNVAATWSREHRIRPARFDEFKILRLGVDPQDTFSLAAGELPVAGAIEDMVRASKFDYRYAHAITKRWESLDSHQLMQIFHGVYWLDRDGNHPKPGTILTVDSVTSGEYRVNPNVAWNLGMTEAETHRDALYYLATLSKNGRYPLIIWNYHGQVGGVGHTIMPMRHEVDVFHTFLRGSQWRPIMKGMHPQRENYSIFRFEVTDDLNGHMPGSRSPQLLDELFSYDMVVIDGQAKSHCVAWTVSDLLDEIWARDKRLVKRIYLLEDCTSPVVVPSIGLDFTKDANDAFDRFRDAGVHIVRSTDPLDSWPRE